MEEIIKELRAIKKLIALGAFSIFIIALGTIIQGFFAFTMFKPYKNLLSKNQDYISQSGYMNSENTSFSSKAEKLVGSSKFDELINLSIEQKSKHPSDPYSYYYLGLGHYHKREYKEAVENFNKAVELAPTWKDQTIKPYLKVAEKALADKSSK